MSEYLAWLRFALETEAKGLRFYSECLKRTKNPTAIQLFEFLVNEEKEHERLLKEVLDGLTDSDEEKVTASLDSFKQLKAENPLFDAGEIEKVSDSHLTEMLNSAMKFEQEGIELYQGYSDKTDNPYVKDLFDMLIAKEKEHKERIAIIGAKLLGVQL
jgi:rubrerythrin